MNDDIARWDDEARAFDDAPDHGLRDPRTRGAWRELLLGLLPPAPAHIADLGCGTGTLAVLLAAEGYAVDGVDLSPEMVRRARAKAGDLVGVSFAEGDAAAPLLQPAAYDVVLSRHVLWTMPSPADALRRWVDLLAPGGRLVLVEGSWHTGAGLTARETESLVESIGRTTSTRHLTEPVLWGREIDDERYVVVSPATG